MKLSIFGLGYVGCVSAACFAKAGHEVIGVDANALKADIINAGRSPIVEPGIEQLIAECVSAGTLRAMTDAAEAVANSDVSLVCVGTPGHINGSLDLSYVKRVCQQIGAAIEHKNRFHIVAMRSTMLPGTIAEVVTPTLEVYSNKRAGRDFGVAVNPEFLREGTSLKDFHQPPFTLLGTDDPESSAILRQLYSFIDAPVLVVGTREAEMVKYASNAFHALKVAFANEIGNICKPLGVDSHKVMQVFCEDQKLNLSPYYLKPGFAFGGSCLPKDVRALTYKAKTLDVDVPLLNSVLASNRHQVERAVQMVLQSGKKSVAILGMSFKTGTDDLRESPLVALIEVLLGKGLEIAIYDRDVELARIFGANKQYIEKEIPHISTLMRKSLDEVLGQAELIIIGKAEDEYRKAAEMLSQGKVVLDLVRLLDDCRGRPGYEGINW